MFLELAPQLQGLSETVRLHKLHGHRPARPELPPV